MAIGKLIKKIAEEQGRSIKWLSSQTGINENTLYAIIKRDSDNITQENIEKISEAFELSAVDFLTYALDEASKSNDMKAYGVLIDKYIYAMDKVVQSGASSDMSIEDRTQAIRIALDEKAEKAKQTLANIGALSLDTDSLTADELMELMNYRDYLIYKRTQNNGK